MGPYVQTVVAVVILFVCEISDLCRFDHCVWSDPNMDYDLVDVLFIVNLVFK